MLIARLRSTRHEILVVRTEESGEPLCVKRPAPDLRAPAAELERLRRNLLKEAGFLRRLRHPGVPEFRGVGRDGEFVAMRLVPGSRLDRARPGLPRADRLAVASDLLGLVSFFQRETVIHRDIKPRNIVVRRRQGPARAVLVDYGSMEWEVQPRVDHGPRRAKLGGGAYLFQPPEQLLSDFGRLDRRADCFAVGATLHWLLLERVPYRNVEPKPGAVLSSYRRQENALWRGGGLRRLPFRELAEMTFELLRARPEARLVRVDQVREVVDRLLASREPGSGDVRR